FWPAAILLSVAFGSIHLKNPGEGIVGALDVFVIAMFFCLTLRRTGNLWFAIGMHASFDWGETFIYSVPNSGTVATGHLLNMSLHGSRWITGGTVGPEGSVFSFIFTGVAFVLFAWLYPLSKSAAESSGSQNRSTTVSSSSAQ
ncbi:MAG: lysostaphin resistance A-like protein, partial [Blastocatellia bacterium]